MVGRNYTPKMVESDLENAGLSATKQKELIKLLTNWRSASRNERANTLRLLTGAGGKKKIEAVPHFEPMEGDKVLANENNARIVLTRDRTGVNPETGLMLGYGPLGQSQAAAIDLVVGGGLRPEDSWPREIDENGEKLTQEPNFGRDPARIYISQKTDIDNNFQIRSNEKGNDSVSAGIPNMEAMPAIGLKADAVRIMARTGGVKIVTGVPEVKNSRGGMDVFTPHGIDLVAGNDPSNLQPIPKGHNLRHALEELMGLVDELSGIVGTLLVNQMKLNIALTAHFHHSPFFGIPTTPSPTVVPAGTACGFEHLSVTLSDLVKNKNNLGAFQSNYLEDYGPKYINSKYNNVN